MALPLEKRFWGNIYPEPNCGCWLWTGTIVRGGYGQIMAAGKKMYAHRLAFELKKGPIPEGLSIDHKCSVRSCVNPDHLEAVTHQENVRRTWMRGLGWNPRINMTHCPRGHEFTAENTYTAPKTRQRQCRVCISIRAKRRKRHRT